MFFKLGKEGAAEPGFPEGKPGLILLRQAKGRAVFQSVLAGIGASGVPAHKAGPADGKRRIVPGDAALVIGVVEVVAFVAELRHVGKHQESMGESPGNQELVLVFLGQKFAVPAPVGPAAAAKVHGNVIYTAADDAHQLALGELLLKVQPAQHAFAAHGLVVLHEGDVDACFGHVGLVIGFHEIAAAVSVDGGGDKAKPCDAVQIPYELNLAHFLPPCPADTGTAHPSSPEGA